jgi:signal transduction histidine kinase
MTLRPSRLLLATLALGGALIGIFATLLLRSRAELHAELRRIVIERSAAILLPVAQQQIASVVPAAGTPGKRPEDLLLAVLQSAQQDDMLAVAVFDAQGNLVRALPATLLFAELAAEDYLSLLRVGTISRFHAEFPLGQHFTATAPHATAPVLEVLLGLERRGSAERFGFVQYYIDGRPLHRELQTIETRLRRQTATTLGLGSLLVTLVLTGAYFGLKRAEQRIAERNERLARVNFELTLSTKTAALGQITSHLIHGLQGSLAGLRSVVSAGDGESAMRYADRMQALISEIVGLLGDRSSGLTYELSGTELADIIRERGASLAESHGVRFRVENEMTGTIDSHRGSLLCLVAANLVQNAIAATPPGRGVKVHLGDHLTQTAVTVADEGAGIAAAVRARLFEPGVTGRAGGTGLGLAISRLLTLQIGGRLELVGSDHQGTIFRAVVPRHSIAQS